MAAEIITSADFGQVWCVEVEYNTTATGCWVDDDKEHATTLHGPFKTEAEAVAWMDAYPDDTDVRDMWVLVMNQVREEVNTHG